MTTRIDHTGHDHPATPAGRADCRKAYAEIDRQAVRLVEQFRNSWGMQAYVQRACIRFCGTEHETWTRDENGVSHRTQHHWGDIECCRALVRKGMTFSAICYAYS